MKGKLLTLFVLATIPSWLYGQSCTHALSGTESYSGFGCSTTPSGTPAINITNIGSNEELVFDANITTTGNVILDFIAKGKAITIPAGYTLFINGNLEFLGSNGPTDMIVNGNLVVTGDFIAGANITYSGTGSIRVDGNWSGNGGQSDCPNPCGLSFNVGGTCSQAGSNICIDVANFLLPIELHSFQAIYQTGQVTITWSTVWEKGNDFFTLERSADGLNWETFRIVDGSGTTYNTSTYRVFDAAPYPFTTYYRLKQTDFDGASSYSSVVEVHTGEMLKMEVFPNPASDQVSLLAGFRLAGSTISLFDTQGKIHYQNLVTDATGWKTQLPVGHLPMGLYLLECLTPQGQKLSQKLVIQH